MIRKYWAWVFAVAILVIFASGGGGGERFSLGELSFVSSAHAIVGRPLTPVSVAGVARRTARRCAAGVYYC